MREGRMAGWAPPLIPGIVLLLADGYRLGRLSLWRDEAYTVDAIGRPLPRVFAMLAHTDVVNGAYYLLMHAWAGAAGTSPAALRLPSLLAMPVAESPAAAANLSGAELAAGILRERFARVGRVWVVSGRRMFPLPDRGLEPAEAGLLRRFSLARRWYAGEGMLTLYVRQRARGRPVTELVGQPEHLVTDGDPGCPESQRGDHPDTSWPGMTEVR